MSDLGIHGGWTEKPQGVNDYRDLVAWQVAIELCLGVYSYSRSFPGDEKFGIRSEMRKTARSVCCNIAEGQQRGTTREFVRFLDIAQGSRAELETQLVIARRLGYLTEDAGVALFCLTSRVGRLTSSLRSVLKRRI